MEAASSSWCVAKTEASNWGGEGPHGQLLTDIWGPAHCPNLDGILLCLGGLRGGSQGPSYVTILYVALHLTQLLPDLKQGGVGLCKYTARCSSTLHILRHADPVGGLKMLSQLKPLWGPWFGT